MTYQKSLKMLSVSLVCFSGGFLPAQNPEENAPATQISLEEVIQATLVHNLSYQIVALDPAIARDTVLREKSTFDSELFATGRIAQTEQSTTFTQTTGTSSDNRSWNLGVRKRTSLGTTLTAQTNLDRRDSNAGVNTSNLSQSADLSISLRQPLMSGFGREANLAGIESARAGFFAEKGSFQDTVRNILSETERAYWTVSRWQEQLTLNESSLQVAEALLAEAKERERVGLVTQIEVLQAEASRAQFLEQIIETRKALGDAMDIMFTYMGLLFEDDFLDSDNSYQVKELPDISNFEMEFVEIWNLAMLQDPILASQEATIAQREWETVAARNAARPNLDLVLSGAYTGLDNEDANEAFDKAFHGDGHAWAVGVEFSMPWGLRAEKASLRIRKTRLEQEEIRYQELKQSLFREVRSAWRTLKTVQQSLEAAKLTVSLQEAAFEREKGKYEQGLSVFRDVLEVQRDLDQARIRLLQAKFNSLSAEIDLARLSGRLFERHGMDPAAWEPQLNSDSDN